MFEFCTFIIQPFCCDLCGNKNFFLHQLDKESYPYEIYVDGELKSQVSQGQKNFVSVSPGMHEVELKKKGVIQGAVNFIGSRFGKKGQAAAEAVDNAHSSPLKLMVDVRSNEMTPVRLEKWQPSDLHRKVMRLREGGYLRPPFVKAPGMTGI